MYGRSAYHMMTVMLMQDYVYNNSFGINLAVFY